MRCRRASRPPHPRSASPGHTSLQHGDWQSQRAGAEDALCMQTSLVAMGHCMPLSAGKGAARGAPWWGSTPPCANSVSLTMSTVGFLASSRAMGCPGAYMCSRARSVVFTHRSASPRTPAASAASRNPPGVAYLTARPSHGPRTRGADSGGQGCACTTGCYIPFLDNKHGEHCLADATHHQHW